MSHINIHLVFDMTVTNIMKEGTFTRLSIAKTRVVVCTTRVYFAQTYDKTIFSTDLTEKYYLS